MAAAQRRATAAASPTKSGKAGRKAAAAGGAPSAAAAGKETTAAAAPAGSPLARAFYQHGGLVLCVTGVALLWAGYGRGWMHDTTLTLLCVAFNLLGLFLHETRPWSLERELNAQREAQAEAAKAR